MRTSWVVHSRPLYLHLLGSALCLLSSYGTGWGKMFFALCTAGRCLCLAFGICYACVFGFVNQTFSYVFFHRDSEGARCCLTVWLAALKGGAEDSWGWLFEDWLLFEGWWRARWVRQDKTGDCRLVISGLPDSGCRRHAEREEHEERKTSRPPPPPLPSSPLPPFPLVTKSHRMQTNRWKNRRGQSKPERCRMAEWHGKCHKNRYSIDTWQTCQADYFECAEIQPPPTRYIYIYIHNWDINNYNFCVL